MSEAPRPLGPTGHHVPPLGLGCWQLGADWGEVDDQQATEVLRASYDAGVRLFDTADVYGDGRSEQRIARFLRDLGPDADDVVVATKAGRRADPHVPEAFTPDNLRAWIDRSRRNLGVEALDLVQLHCPPTPVFDDDEVFGALRELVDEGHLRAYGVSVETVAEGRTALRHGIASIQVIVNVLRQKPLTELLPQAADSGVAILARVPLASGLLSGRYTRDTTFAADDHRTYNRDGQAFDVGETFAGVPFEVGVDAAREVAELAPDGVTPAQLALRWLVDLPQVTAAIPGARTAEQARANAAVLDLPPLDDATTDALRAIYDRDIRRHVHDRW
ncbi:aldo/keto reductase [Nitriliruptoraceae bacterium ZYF776]|nr:aldo/keto reductase [Profundirhabdus halotolerans]